MTKHPIPDGATAIDWSKVYTPKDLAAARDEMEAAYAAWRAAEHYYNQVRAAIASEEHARRRLSGTQK